MHRPAPYFLKLVFLLLAGIPSALDAQTNCIPCDRASNASLLPPMVGQAEHFAVRRSGAEVNAGWKVPISQDGWYRLSQSQLIAAGMNSGNLVGSQIRMFCRTQEVAILVTSSNLWTSQDALYFYGIKHDGEYTRTNVYWLGLGGEGRRIATIPGAPLGGETLITSACYSAVYDAKNLYRPFHEPLDTSIDHWFAALLNTSTPTTVLFDTTNRVPGELARYSIELYGLTENPGVNPDHRTRIQMNNATMVASPTYDGTVYFATNYLLSGTNLSSGVTTNSLLQNATGVANDLAYLISARLDYMARIIQKTPHHEFCGRPGTNLYRVRDLTATNGLFILDVTDPYDPVRITGETYTNVVATPGLWLTEFRHVTNRISRFAVVQTNGVLEAPSPVAVLNRNLADETRQADYLMITASSLREQSYRLARQRYTNGLTVVVAPVDDIYNEFGYGVVDADAIKQFIGYAYHHWRSPKPRFALLIGEGSYDPLGHLGALAGHFIPVKFGPTPFVVAAHDNWYGLVNGTTNGVDDALPDVIVGRMALSSNSVLSNIVSKVMAHDRGDFSTNALVVTDAATNINFKASSDAYIKSYLASNGWSIVEQNRNLLPNIASQAGIVNAINGGRRFVSYVGHGAFNLWSSANLLNTTNMASLSNTTAYPVVAIYSCQNGYFVDRETNSLSEAFMEVPRGAVAVFSPAALSFQLFSDYLADGFSKSYVVQKRRHLGDVVRESYVDLYMFNPDAAELRTYQIMGDPGLIVNRPGTLP